MSLIIKAPEEFLSLENVDNDKLFLAGGITNVCNWQEDICSGLEDVVGLTIYNPRRDDFYIDDPLLEEEQIIWEFNHLRDCNMLLFWFSNETVQPITLYELGKWVNGNPNNKDKVWIGVDPNYPRANDVYIQTHLASPHIKIYNNLYDIQQNIRSYFNEYERDIRL